MGGEEKDKLMATTRCKPYQPVVQLPPLSDEDREALRSNIRVQSSTINTDEISSTRNKLSRST